MDQIDDKDQPDQLAGEHSHGHGHRRRHSHRNLGKWKLTKHWVKKHLWNKYWMLIIAIVLGLLVAKYCVPVDF
ncbi:MAG: hypothetical protein PHE84_12885 [bacterium]|nr:hypothetical protein [bacterium]